jgi:hypothetical protein
MVLLRADGSLLAGGSSIDIGTHGLDATARRAARQSGSPADSISPPRSPDIRGGSPERQRGSVGVSATSGSFLPRVMSPEAAEHRAKVAARLSSGEAVHRRQKETMEFRVRSLRSRSLSPVRTGRTVSPQGRLAREVARRAEQEAVRRSQVVVLSADERATQAAIERLADKTTAMELASEAMKHQLAVEAEIIRARDVPKTHAVSSDQFGLRVAALHAARLEESELPDALWSAGARLSWPRRSPSPQDCIGAIDRGQRSARLQQWRSQLLGTPPESPVDERQVKNEAALASIPVALQRHDQKLESDKAAAGAFSDGARRRRASPFSAADGATRDYTSMDWLDTVGRARLVSPRRSGARTHSATGQNLASPSKSAAPQRHRAS